MKHVPNLPVEVLVGGQLADILCRPLSPYSKEAVNFLAILSKRLLNNPAVRSYPDIAGFAYWCRNANLAQLSRNFDAIHRRVGRGLVLHIAPANVPVNFAFSFAFGLLAGNANIVRIPGANHPQAAIICGEMAEILQQPEHSRIAAMTRIVHYPRENAITVALSAVCHARVLWGGDATIAHLRSMKTSPRCVDICFADRYSICIMGADAILSANAQTLDALISGFYNDVFLLDQDACSSPHLIMWQGNDKAVAAAKTRFWQSMENHLHSKLLPPPIHAIDKYTHLCRTAIRLDGSLSNLEQANLIYRVGLENVPEDIEDYRGQHGFFVETTDNDLACLELIVGERYQTVTCFGVDAQKIVDRVVASGLTGIDRVVPVGKALDIGVIWDGYDLVGTLSRIISNQ